MPNSNLDDRNSHLFKLAFYLLGGISLILLPLASLGFGITWDEQLQGHYGKLILRYFLSGGTNRDFASFAETAYLYGGLFDTLSGFIYSVLFSNPVAFARSGLWDTVNGLSGQDLQYSGYFEVRHVLNALFGCLTLFAAGGLARLISSWRAAFLALLFLLLSPRFLGHAMNNPKDIPFAAAYMLALYGMALYAHQFPAFSKRSGWFIGLGLAMALGIRAGGLILFFYFVVCQLFLALSAKKRGLSFRTIPVWTRFLLICVAGYLGGLVFWPYGHMNPFLNPFLAFKAFSNFSGAASELIFEGKWIKNTELPWYYLPKWILISVPFFFHAGMGLLIWAAFKKKIRKISIPFAAAFLGAFFPIVMVILQKPILYDGWRHFIFVYPPLVILAAVGWDIFLSRLSSGKKNFFVTLFLIVMLGEPLLWMVRHHPHQHVYFNSWVGGTSGANGYYQTDYWGNCIREASDWLGDYLQDKRDKDIYLVHADGSVMSSFPFLKRKLKNRYWPYVQAPLSLRTGRQPDYGIFLSKRVPPDQLKAGLWPPLDETIYTVKVEDVVLCAVVENKRAAT